MPATTTQCACCQMPISDPTTQVVRGDKTFCCPNCAAAMERGGAEPPRGAPTCVECGVAIVDRSTMRTRAGESFCCPNCLNAMDNFQEPPPSR